MTSDFLTCDFLGMAAPGVQGLHPYVPGKPMQELERELGIQSIVKLASNENPLGPGPKARAAIEAAAAECHRYPDGSGHALKQALAERLGRSPRELTLGNGSNEVLELIARAFLTPGRSAVFSRHAFAVYGLVTQACGAESRVAPATAWGHDVEALVASLGENTRLMFIANPNNPTGTWIDGRALTWLLERVPREVLVVLDEAYSEYLDDPDFPDGVSLLDRYPNLVVTRTFSKAYGLAGLRVGYALSHPDLAEILNRVREPFNVNSLALSAAQAALEDEDHLARSVALNAAGREQLTRALADLSLQTLPAAGNFLALDVGDAEGVYQKLLRQGVILRPLAGYEMPCHLRVSIGLEEENRRFLHALEQVLAE